jgi:hypothetical protein
MRCVSFLLNLEYKYDLKPSRNTASTTICLIHLWQFHKVQGLWRLFLISKYLFFAANGCSPYDQSWADHRLFNIFDNTFINFVSDLLTSFKKSHLVGCHCRVQVYNHYCCIVNVRNVNCLVLLLDFRVSVVGCLCVGCHSLFPLLVPSSAYDLVHSVLT